MPHHKGLDNSSNWSSYSWAFLDLLNLVLCNTTNFNEDLLALLSWMSKQKTITPTLYWSCLFIQQVWKTEFNNLLALDSILLKISGFRITEAKERAAMSLHGFRITESNKTYTFESVVSIESLLLGMRLRVLDLLNLK